MDWNFIGSIFWKFGLGVLLLALTALVGYLCAAVGSFRNSLNSIQNTLNSIENIVNQEIGELITDVDKTVNAVNEELPELLQNINLVLSMMHQTADWVNTELPGILQNINGLTASLQGISESEIQPTVHNIQEMSGALNQSIQELDELVQKVSNFSGQTIEQATFFRNQLVVSLADIVGLWQGIKAGWDSFSSTRSPEPEEEPLMSDVSNE